MTTKRKKALKDNIWVAAEEYATRLEHAAKKYPDAAKLAEHLYAETEIYKLLPKKPYTAAGNTSTWTTASATTTTDWGNIRTYTTDGTTTTMDWDMKPLEVDKHQVIRDL